MAEQGTLTVGYLCQVQLPLQMARGAQFMALGTDPDVCIQIGLLYSLY